MKKLLVSAINGPKHFQSDTNFIIALVTVEQKNLQNSRFEIHLIFIRLVNWNFWQFF